MKTWLSTLALLALTVSCGKGSNFVYNQKPVKQESYIENRAVVGDGGQVDILWVIDDSGSMSDIQSDVIANTGLFMEEFIKNKSLDWRMGLISTTRGRDDLLGFKAPFTWKSPNPVDTFQTAVRALGLSGGTELEMDTTVDVLKKYPNFLRKQAHFVTIFVTDEREQSTTYNAQTYLDEIVRLKGGHLKLYKAYGAFQATDFGCNGTGGSDSVVYGGSPFEAIINATGGKPYSTCTANFGVDLAALGKEIVSAVSSPVVMLKKRPIPSTIKVVYNGEELLPGAFDEGGFWMYDPEVNGVRFHSLDFVDFDIKNVKISYDVDQGVI